MRSRHGRRAPGIGRQQENHRPLPGGQSGQHPRRAAGPGFSRTVVGFFASPDSVSGGAGDRDPRLVRRSGARLAGRISGDATVAHSWAFCQTAERAAGLETPPRATALRAVLCERERMTLKPISLSPQPKHAAALPRNDRNAWCIARAPGSWNANY